MSTETLNRSLKVAAWKGTPAQLCDYIDMAAAQVADVAPPGSEVRFSAQIKDGGRSTDFDSPADLRGGATYDRLSEMDELTVHVRDGDGDLSAFVVFRRDGFKTGVSVSVSGPNGVLVDGVMSRLTEGLEKGKRRFAAFQFQGLSVMFVGLGVLMTCTVVAAVTGYTPWVVVVTSLVIAGAGIFIEVGLPIFVPQLEILDPENPKPRTQRWWVKVLAIVGAILLSAFTVVLTVVLESKMN